MRGPHRFVYLILGPLLLLSACGEEEAGLPDPSSETYREVVNAFYTGVAAIQAGEDQGAEEQLVRVTELAPGEPAAWADLGLLALRRNEMEEAQERLERARELAPDDARVLMLLAQLESNQGRFDEAIAHLREAVEKDPQNVRARYALLQALERQAEPGWEEEAQSLLRLMLQQRPDNAVLLLQQVRLAAQQGDEAALNEALEPLQEQAVDWPEEARQHLNRIREANADGRLQEAATEVAFLTNVLKSDPEYRRDLQAVQTSAAEVGELITRFIRLPEPEPSPAPADTTLSFTAAPEGEAAAAPYWVGAFHPGNEQAPVVAAASSEQFSVGGQALPVPGRPAAGGRQGIAPLDYNYDFRMDVALAGTDGVRLFRQDTTGTFENVTQSALPTAAIDGAYTGVWAADVDTEGDIDLVLGRPESGPLVLRNNGDGTFTVQQLFGDIANVRGFAWADVDVDGDPDAVLLDGNGQLHALSNERRAQFLRQDLPDAPADVRAITAGDLDQNGRIDLVALTGDGAVVRFSTQETGGWTRSEATRWASMPAVTTDGPVHLLTADLDNNGAHDLVASADGRTGVWLGQGGGQLTKITASPEASIFDGADLDGDGRVDLIGLAESGQPARFTNEGTQEYNWQVLRPRAAQTIGDQRINSFGIGGEVEVRSGLLYQKLPITTPRVHIGLGEHEQAQVIRIIWPNGDVQAEFDLASGQPIETPQRLKGSCPWLFTYDGEGMQFVTDFIWRSPLGLRINAQETAGVMMTEDWVKIRGDQLVPRDGYYDVRITADLWETHFFDHVSLLVVDHPAETEIFVDERFAFPPPALAVHATSPPRPVASARDHRGRDVTDRVVVRDDRHLGGFDRTVYQGLAEEHYVEVDLGEEAMKEDALVLVASGWTRPTDSSINVAISQGERSAPEGITLEVPDGRGGWRVARSGLGFPAGKDKTIVLDLQGIFEPGAPRRLRLRTTMEIYWDALQWAVSRSDARLDTLRIDPQQAELRYRGFSAVSAPEQFRPERPNYDILAGTAPRWQDLSGYYTRFGDVRPLLKEIDDRYVIMNAGDEMRFQFAAPDEPPAGWQRDFVLIGDGWVKDGDLNTAFSKTLRPLPSHGDPAYDTPPGPLSEDPVYRRHRSDWQKYHTRYVTPHAFWQALHAVGQ